MSPRRLILAVCFFSIVVNTPFSSGSPQPVRPAKPAARYSDKDLLIAPDHTLVRDSSELVGEKKGQSRRSSIRQRPTRIAKTDVAHHPHGQLREPVIVKRNPLQNKTIMYRNKIPIKIDYDKGTYTVLGKDIPIPVDNAEWEEVRNALQSVESWVNISYPRFNAFVDSDFYEGREQAIEDYLDKLHARLLELESQTGWSSEEFYGKKLDIYVYDSGSSCTDGFAFGGEAYIGLHTLFGNSNICKKPYYVDGVETWNNPGEYGDQWMFGWIGLHETSHAINPLPFLNSNWLTEGLAEYFGFNILVDYGDINSETADYYVENANFSLNYGSFGDYVSNDYKDKFNNEIQVSRGYDITAWMFSMMRDNHSLDWSEFFSILDDNMRLLDDSMSLGQYYTDTFVIDVFGKASGLDWASTETIWRYDGPGGPGWGVRNIMDRNWYPDLAPILNFSNGSPLAGETIDVMATVSNNGDVSLMDVSVRFYEGTMLLDEQIVDVPAQGNTVVTSGFSAGDGTYTITVKVDEDDVKIETDDTNNDDSEVITFTACDCGIKGDVNDDASTDPLDVTYLVNFVYLSQDALAERPDCPYPKGDMNCDESADPLDVTYLVNYVYLSQDALCDGCSE